MMYKTETPNWHLNMAERHAEKLAQENAALREALVECMDALEMSYDVNDYPANGKTIQDAATAKASKLLTELGGGDD